MHRSKYFQFITVFIALYLLVIGALLIMGVTGLGDELRWILYADFIGRFIEGSPSSEMCCILTPFTLPVSLAALGAAVLLLKRIIKSS